MLGFQRHEIGIVGGKYAVIRDLCVERDAGRARCSPRSDQLRGRIVKIDPDQARNRSWPTKEAQPQADVAIGAPRRLELPKSNDRR